MDIWFDGLKQSFVVTPELKGNARKEVARVFKKVAMPSFAAIQPEVQGEYEFWHVRLSACTPGELATFVEAIKQELPANERTPYRAGKSCVTQQRWVEFVLS